MREGAGMKPQIRVAFAFFWPGFTAETFRGFFPFVYDKYDIVPSSDPDVVFYSVFAPNYQPYGDPRHPAAGGITPGRYVRVFMTGENFEPAMNNCEFAISFSQQVRHPNHLRLPLWAYENRGWGYGPQSLVKQAGTDWEEIAAAKTEFCNYVYLHPVPYRDQIFAALNAYKRVDAAGRCMNNMNGWTVPMTPNRLAGKLEFFRRYKFTLALENAVWPGYMTEKLVDPMYANSIPIYVGDPKARESFNPESYIDAANFRSVNEMLEFARAVDNDRDLYMRMLAAPWYRNNEIPDYAREDTIRAFFDRIVAAALARR
jgi:hypothetical protein